MGKEKSMDVERLLIKRIKELADRKAWSINQLADFSGLSRGYVSRVMRGQCSPTVKTLAKFADGLEVEVRDLFV